MSNEKEAEAPASQNTVSSTFLGFWSFLSGHLGLATFLATVLGLVAGAAFACCQLIWHGAVFYNRATEIERQHHETQERYEKQKATTEQLYNELKKRDEIIVDHGILFYASDSLPRFPLCPLIIPPKNFDMSRISIIVNAI